MLDGKYVVSKGEGAHWAIVGPDGNAVPTDDDLYSYEHAMDVLRSITRREGKTMEVTDNTVPTIVRVSSGSPPREPVAPPKLRYAPDSIRAIDLVKDRVGEILDHLARRRVLIHGRDVVTADDVVRCIGDALRKVIEETDPATHGS